MIPELTSAGVLPPGVHDTDLDEIRGRFGKKSAIRRRLMKGLASVADQALAAGALELYVNGSFVTTKDKPGDWDGVLVVPVGFHPGMGAGRYFSDLPKLQKECGCDLFMLYEDDNEAIDHYVKDVFGKDREGRPKGILRIRLKGAGHGTDQE